MKIGDSVRLAIAEWERGELESAMMHACNAVDGTAKKAHPTIRSNKGRFTRLLRDNYWILGPMGAPGINLVGTWSAVDVRNPTAPGGKPDMADVVYAIHRCAHGHGDELPKGFELIPNVAGPAGYTRMELQPGKIRLSDRMIFALLAVAVLSRVNEGQTVPDDYYLSYGDSKMPINEWWGRAHDFHGILAAGPSMPYVKIDPSTWTT